MPNEVLANEVLAPLPEAALSESDYRAFCAALEASARGRAFLAEYAQRNRHANTEILLTALDRLETLVRNQTASTEADRIRQELRALLAALRSAQPTIDSGAAAITAAKLVAMIGFVQHRIESIVADERSPLPAEVFALVMPEEATVEAARSHLAVVPRSDEPELPIPSPVAQGLAIALVPERVSAQPELEPPQPVLETPQPIAETIEPAPTHRTAAIIPDVNLFDPVPAKPPVVAGPGPATTASAMAEPYVIATEVAAAAIAEVLIDNINIAATVEPIDYVIVETVVAPAVEQAAKAEPIAVETAVVEVTAVAVATVETPVVEIAAATTIALPQQPIVETVAAPAAIAVATPEVAEPVASLPPDDPLALIMALSEAERIALFT